MPIWVRQAAAVPVRDGRVCLVRSSSGRRWVVPKGQIEVGHTPREAALAEAWEEAGVVGAIDAEPLGSYAYEKLGRELFVLVYRLVVTEARDEWPERHFRNRTWFPLGEALDRIEEPGLRELVAFAFHAKQQPPRPFLVTA
ncbi:NUDIX domain-containing protein [Gemmata sp. JC717]|uniref:NUDIX domain-containing protein n=1 Tax=Gemmata algarum TaxID=2975278 RepID=A0ABU5F3A2_9BACT|nr:NUDIX domain-containing protein [Gemmata algarum]MDY3551114.1 NUDIX domain-containing protein [Gemmata algarum]MDY3561984.1 NUDIX domain-containing protein [Gemmata algarum]